MARTTTGLSSGSKIIVSSNRLSHIGRGHRSSDNCNPPLQQPPNQPRQQPLQPQQQQQPYLQLGPAGSQSNPTPNNCQTPNRPPTPLPLLLPEPSNRLPLPSQPFPWLHCPSGHSRQNTHHPRISQTVPFTAHKQWAVEVVRSIDTILAAISQTGTSCTEAALNNLLALPTRDLDMQAIWLQYLSVYLSN